VIYVGGIGGGRDSPARELYPKLSRKVISNGISSLRIRYRHPTYLDECVKDVIAGIKVLENNRIQSVGLVGHSLGGAVVIKAAAVSTNIVKTVVTLATQSYGAVEPVSQYLEEKIWKPLGMEASASWSLDSDTNRFEKMVSMQKLLTLLR
jgi:predicted alpha/beta hydrolase family esterase